MSEDAIERVNMMNRVGRPMSSVSTPPVPAGEVGELVECPSDLSGLLLALGLILSRPISDANRQHFAAQCFNAADRIVPGVSAIARSVLQAGD